MRLCIDCKEPLIPGEEWTETYQKWGLYRHVSCNRKLSRGASKAKYNPKTNAVSRLMEDRMKALGIAQKDIYLDEHMALRKRLRKEIRNSGEWKQLAPDQIKKAKPRKVPKLTETEAVVKRTNDAAVLAAMRHNLRIEKGQCEFTGEESAVCEVCHIFPRGLAKQFGQPEYVTDMDNVFFGLSLINVAMDRAGHYLDLDGYIKVMMDYQHLDTLSDLGVYHAHIEMTEGRMNYARLAKEALGIT